MFGGDPIALFNQKSALYPFLPAEPMVAALLPANVFWMLDGLPFDVSEILISSLTDAPTIPTGAWTWIAEVVNRLNTVIFTLGTVVQGIGVQDVSIPASTFDPAGVVCGVRVTVQSANGMSATLLIANLSITK